MSAADRMRLFYPDVPPAALAAVRALALLNAQAPEKGPGKDVTAAALRAACRAALEIGPGSTTNTAVQAMSRRATRQVLASS